MKSSSTANKMNYNVYLMDANDTADVDYFNNEQIKFALVKNGTYVADTSSSAGKKLSEVAGFTRGTSEGEGLVLKDQEIASNVTDTYKLRIWISDDVNYSNTVDGQDEQTSKGKYNGYKYSLKVKVTAGMGASESTVIQTPTVNNLTITTKISDPSGLYAYAITESNNAPAESSDEWIIINESTASSNVLKVDTFGGYTEKTITYMVKKNGTYYLHVQNQLGKVKSKSFVVNATGEKATTKIINIYDEQSYYSGISMFEHEATGNQNFAVKEYRYVGSTADNYVWFNNELWRIIGAMDVDNGTGLVEKRLKIMRGETLSGTKWDASDANSNMGMNEWSNSTLMSILNTGDYYNRTNIGGHECYDSVTNTRGSCDYTSTGLTDEAKELIGNAKWYLGASSSTDITRDDMYVLERGNGTGKDGCTSSSNCDNIERKSSWVGQVGLMYPSDFAFSTTSCDRKLNNYYDCYNSTWIKRPSNSSAWTITPASSNSSMHVFVIPFSETFSSGSPAGFNYHKFYPTVYLNENVKILDGDGTTERPFVLSK